MLDSAQYEPLNKVGGRIKQETLGWMKAQLEEAGKQGITVIPIAHHNLLKESILYPEDCTYHISEVVADSFAISPCRYGVLQWTEDGRLVYTPRAMDVEGWARKEGITDENLLNFKEYGMKFLTEVISSQVSGKIKNLPEEQVVKMAELYGDINRAYCEGVPVDGTEVRSEEAFRLWQRNLPDSRCLLKSARS